MPNLLLFAPCQKVIINGQDNTVSLIGLLENVTVSVEDGSVSENAVAPSPWDVIVIWERLPEDMGILYDQRIQLLLADGNESLESVVQFEMAERTIRNMLNIRGFPIGQAGSCALRLSIREANTGEDWRVLAGYPITVSYSESSQIDQPAQMSLDNEVPSKGGA